MKIFLKLIFLLLIPINLSAQLTPVTNQYILNPLTINPAYAGSRGALSVAAFFRKQWVGVSGAPETKTLALDVPVLDSKLGLGLIITNDMIGVTKKTQFQTNYAYKIRMGEGKLSFGLGAGIIATNTAWSDLVVIDPGDEYFLVDSRVFLVPDFSFGVYYSYRNYFIGISVPKLMSYEFDFNRNKYSMGFNPDQNYYLFNTGYVFNFSSNLKFLPSALVTYSPEDRVLYDINAHFGIFDRMWIGASYRNDRSVAALFQVSINKQLKVAYTYDFDYGNLERFDNGSHEIMLRYEFLFKVDAINPLRF